MSTSPEQIHNKIISDLIKKRIIEKIEDLFKLGAKQDKYTEKNLATLNNILNHPDANLPELKQEMVNIIKGLNLEKYELTEQSGFEKGIIACIKALQSIGIATENWNFGSQNIQNVLISTRKKVRADIEKQLKELEKEIFKQIEEDNLKYQDIPANFKRDAFIIELIELELKLKEAGIAEEQINEFDFVSVHPFQLIDEHFSSRSETVQKHILKLVDSMPHLTMRLLTKPDDELQTSMKEFGWKLNDSIMLLTIQNDANALEFLPDEFHKNEHLFEAALLKNASQLQFVPEAMRQKLIDKIGAENLLKNNVLAYKYFPQTQANTQAINSFLAKIENIVVNPSLNNAELNDATSVYGNKAKRKDNTAFVGFNFNSQFTNPSNSKAIQKELDELMLAIKAANNQKDIHLAIAAHSNIGTESTVGFLSLDHIAELCETHSEIKQLNLLTCSAAGEQDISEKEQQMMNDLRKKEQGTKKYLFVTQPPNQSEESLKKYCLELCEKNKTDGVYFLIENKQGTPKYKLQMMKIVDNQLFSKTMDVPSNKETFIQRIKVQQNEKVKNNSGKLTALSFAELIELRSTTSEHHRFDPKHPKFQKDKKRFPFLAKFEIEEKDLKKSKMKSLVDALRKKNLTQQVQIQAYTGFMEVDTETHYLRATTGHTFHLRDYEKGVDRVKVLTQYKDRLNKIVQGTAKTSDAKKVSVTVKPPNAQPENNPATEEEVQNTVVEIPVVATEEIASVSEAAPDPIPLVEQPEISIKLKEEINQLRKVNKCDNLVELKQSVRDKINEIVLKSADLASETEGLYISSDSVRLAKEKSRIINTFLDTLQKATTDLEYYNTIDNFINSNDYKITLRQARNSVFQALNLTGTSADLIEDLHQVAFEYVKNNSNPIKTPLM